MQSDLSELAWDSLDLLHVGERSSDDLNNEIQIITQAQSSGTAGYFGV